MAINLTPWPFTRFPAVRRSSSGALDSSHCPQNTTNPPGWKLQMTQILSSFLHSGSGVRLLFLRSQTVLWLYLLNMSIEDKIKSQSSDWLSFLDSMSVSGYRKPHLNNLMQSNVTPIFVSKSRLKAVVLLYCVVLFRWGDAFTESTLYLIKGQILPPSGCTLHNRGSPHYIHVLHFPPSPM